MQINPETLAWLLQPKDPGVRYLALRDLVRLPANDPELLEARRSAYQEGQIARVLDAMQPEGYWVKPGPGYGPKYKSTVWAIILLAQLGAHREQDARIEAAGRYMLAHTLAPSGQFSYNGGASGTFDCLQGNLCWALHELGYEAELEGAYEWMARSQTGEGIAPLEDKRAPVRYYAYKCGPNYACGANSKEPCAWGAIKVMLAFSVLPLEKHTPLIKQAILRGFDLLLGVDPFTGAYPHPGAPKPSQRWWQFGFPVFYVSDVLQIVEAVTPLASYHPGLAAQLENTLNFVCAKGGENQRWALENDTYRSKTWGSYGPKKDNKWVALRALRALSLAEALNKPEI